MGKSLTLSQAKVRQIEQVPSVVDWLAKEMERWLLHRDGITATISIALRSAAGAAEIPSAASITSTTAR